MKTLLALAGLLFSTATAAFASSSSQDTRYLAYFHFNDSAFGKQVNSVTVHAGIQQHTQWAGAETTLTWESVQDLPMERTEKGFFAKGSFKGNDSVNSGGKSVGLGIVVQYWVTFMDGTTTITDSHLHGARGIHTCSPVFYRHALSRFEKASVSEQTEIEKFALDEPCVEVEEEELRH